MTDAHDAVNRFFTLWNERSFELADGLFDPEFVPLPIAYESPLSGQGPESIKHHALSWLLGMPDLRMTEVRRIAEGNWVVSHWEMAGTHKGVLYGVSATGLPLRVQGVTWFEVVDGRIKQLRTSFDALGFLQQLGVLPDAASILANIANSSRP